MIKGYEKIYNLGDLSQLLLEKSKPSLSDIDKKELGQRIKKYIFGEKVKGKARPLNSKSKYWIENFRYYSEIISSFERLFQAYVYLCKYPNYRYYNFYRINEFSWIRYHIEFYLQENYILRERTIKWIERVEEIAKRKSNEELKNRIIKIKRISDKAFKRISRIRGTHVHELRFEPKDYEGIDALNLFISKGKLKELIPLRNLRLTKITLDWKEQIIENNKSLVRFYNILFNSLRKVLIDLE